jgi:hypothetical protein
MLGNEEQQQRKKRREKKQKYKSTNQSGNMQLHKCSTVGQQIVELGRESFCRITNQVNNINRPPQNK